MDQPEQSAAWLRTARALAKRAGCEQAISGALSRDTIEIAIAGTPNAGKSQLINELLGRNLLPVSPLPSQASFVIQAGTPEQFSVANASRPLSQLAGALKSAQGVPIRATLTIDDPWLKGMRLTERPALDADDDTLPKLIETSLRDADIVVLVIDALMPMKRAEVALLRECAQRELPTIIALTKLSEDTVLPYVETQARQYLPDVPVVVNGLKEALVERIARTDIASVRMAQLKGALLQTLEAIHAAALAGADAEAKTQAGRDQDLTQRKHQIDVQNLVWMQIEDQLSRRRQKVEEQIRNHLTTNQTSVLDFLAYDLEKSNDIKMWWERDMPYRLQHELRGQAARISGVIDRQLSTDRKWLQEELHRQFKYPLALGPEPTMAIAEGDIRQRSLSLPDAQKLKIVTRIGTAATVVAAATLLATAGIGGVVIATSVLAGLGAEQWNHHQTKQNREKVRAELNTLIGHASVHYASEISAKLKDWYDEVIAAVKEAQELWQQAQIQALQAARQRPSVRTDWDGILREADALRNEIVA